MEPWETEVEFKSQLKPHIKAGLTGRLRGTILRPDGTRYVQGTGKLCLVNNGTLHFCCLGVMTDMMVQAEPGYLQWETEPYTQSISGIEMCDAIRPTATGFEGALSGEYLSMAIADWAGLPIRGLYWTEVYLPFRDRQGEVVTLARANDAECTFEQIADLIDYFL